jgi:hypothetical protein
MGVSCDKHGRTVVYTGCYRENVTERGNLADGRLGPKRRLRLLVIGMYRNILHRIPQYVVILGVN